MAVCYGCSQIFGRFHHLKGTIINVYTLTSSKSVHRTQIVFDLTVSSLPITNNSALTPFTVTAEVPFRVKDAHYLSVCLSPSDIRGIPVRLADKTDRHTHNTHTHTHSHTHTHHTHTHTQHTHTHTSSIQVNSSSTGTT